MHWGTESEYTRGKWGEAEVTWLTWDLMTGAEYRFWRLVLEDPDRSYIPEGESKGCKRSHGGHTKRKDGTCIRYSRNVKSLTGRGKRSSLNMEVDTTFVEQGPYCASQKCENFSRFMPKLFMSLKWCFSWHIPGQFLRFQRSTYFWLRICIADEANKYMLPLPSRLKKTLVVIFPIHVFW